MDHLGHNQGQGGFQADHSEGRQLELAVLFPCGMRSVVGDDAVDGAVDDAGQQGIAVFLGTQGRIDLQGGVVIVADGIFVQEQVMRGRLAGYLQAFRFSCTDHFQAACGGDVLNVQRAAGQTGQGDVAGDLDFLAFGGPTQHAQTGGNHAFVDLAFADQIVVLLVGHDNAVELGSVVHDAAHHAGTLDAAAVIGEGNGAVGHHVAHFGDDFALQALGCGTGHMDTALTDSCCTGKDVFHTQGIVDDGIGVSHAAHGGETAMGSRTGAGSDIFLLLETGLAQMHVHVDQTGNGDLSAHIAGFALFDGKVLAHFGDLAVADHDVANFIERDLRVDRANILKQ